jgi:hypothetical protein
MNARPSLYHRFSRSPLASAASGVILLLSLGCASGTTTSSINTDAGMVPNPVDTGAATEPTNTEPSASSMPEPDRTSETGCLPSKGSTGNPKTVYELLDLLNGLPHPVELSCFLESLDRPLAFNANSNVQSAQPAAGKRNPRVFLILNESLSVSIVPTADTLEFGQRGEEAGFSLKGEIHFPVQGQLTPEDAFSRLSPNAATGLSLDQATSCGVCHDHERPSVDYPFRGAFISARVKPQSIFGVDVAYIKKETDACDAEAEPVRCAVLHALFDHGSVVQTAFP